MNWFKQKCLIAHSLLWLSFTMFLISPILQSHLSWKMKKINKFVFLVGLICICITLQFYILFGRSGKVQQGQGQQQEQLTPHHGEEFEFDIPTVEGWPPGKSRDMKLYISNPVTGPNVGCDWRDTNKSPLKMLVIVKTATAYLSRRKVIRETWADPSLIPEGVKVIFMVGIDQRKNIIQMIEKESEKFCDIVQVNTIENYMNNTLKMVSALQYLNDAQDINPDHFLFTDDDTYVNLNLLFKEISDDVPWFYEDMHKDLAIVGARFSGGILRPDPKDDFPFVRRSICPEYMWNKNTYPPFLSGAGFLVPYKALKCLATMSMNLPFLHIDDVFITGVVAQECNIERINAVNFSPGRKELKELHKKLLLIHYADSSYMEAYHKYFLNAYKN